MSPPILPVPPAAVTPLPVSSGQRRLWFLSQLHPTSPVYNIPYLLRLSGSLKSEALQRALLTLVQRHEVLRTTFVSIDSEPRQVIRPAGTISLALPVSDLTGIAVSEREAELVRSATEEAKRPFDLAHDLLLRAHLFKLADTEHALLVVVHHIASDGESMVIFYRELAICYQSFANGVRPVLPELLIQFADFAAWQRDYLAGDVRKKLTDYWKKQMAAAPPLLELNPDFLRPATRSHRGGTTVRHLPTELVLALRQLAQRSRATLFMTLLAGLKAVLARRTGRTDIVLATPSSGRDIAEIEGTMGFFVNTIALRTDLSGDPTVTELLARIRDVTLTALEYRDLPYEILVEELHPRRDPSYDPVCQALFALQHVMPPVQLLGIALTIAPVYTGTAKFDLTLWAIEQSDGGIEITAEYASDLFELETIQRLLGHYQVVLEGMTVNPAARLSQLPMLTLAERTQLAGWNGNPATYPPTKTGRAAGSNPRDVGAEPPEKARTPDADIERAISVHWKDILGLDEVGVDENFFNLGGHSMQVLQVRDRLNEELGVDLPVLKLFEYSTIRSLARYVAEQRQAGGIDPLDGLRGRTDARAALRQSALRRQHVPTVHDSVGSHD